MRIPIANDSGMPGTIQDTQPQINPGSKTDAPAPPTTDPSADWATAFFGALGLPSDVQSQVVKILSQHAQDATLAQTLATQYIRSTPWYATHYPGAAAGIQNGTIGNEADYTKYLTQINQLSHQYQGRDVSGSELEGYLNAGYTPGYVGNLFQGQAYIGANRNDIQQLTGAYGSGPLNQGQLTALGNEQAGIDTQLGQLQQKILQRAQTIHDRLFSGTLARPSLSLGTQGVFQPSLAGTKQVSNVTNNPDIGA